MVSCNKYDTFSLSLASQQDKKTERFQAAAICEVANEDQCKTISADECADSSSVKTGAYQRAKPIKALKSVRK